MMVVCLWGGVGWSGGHGSASIAQALPARHCLLPRLEAVAGPPLLPPKPPPLRQAGRQAEPTHLVRHEGVGLQQHGFTATKLPLLPACQAEQEGKGAVGRRTVPAVRAATGAVAAGQATERGGPTWRESGVAGSQQRAKRQDRRQASGGRAKASCGGPSSRPAIVQQQSSPAGHLSTREEMPRQPSVCSPQSTSAALSPRYRCLGKKCLALVALQQHQQTQVRPSKQT